MGRQNKQENSRLKKEEEEQEKEERTRTHPGQDTNQMTANTEKQ